MNRIPCHVLATGLLSCVVLAGCGDRAQAPQPAATATATAAPAPSPTTRTAAVEDCEARRARHDEDAGGRIVGGEPAKPRSAAWQVDFLFSP